MTFNSNKIDNVGFKALSRVPVFILSKDKKSNLSFSDLTKEINQIDWGFEYSSHNVEDILDEGIEHENLSITFLSSVIDDLSLIQDDVYKSDALDLHFYFENNILKSFGSPKGENSATKWLKDVNPSIFKQMLQEANSYHDYESAAIEEVNMQADSLRGIPQAINNEYINLHTKANGNINFYNLLVTHYTQQCDLSEFILVNNGRFVKKGDSKYVVGNFAYEFDDSNQLNSVYNN